MSLDGAVGPAVDWRSSEARERRGPCAASSAAGVERRPRPIVSTDGKSPPRSLALPHSCCESSPFSRSA
eukprot:CAMPEP_0206172772 /NCGR_PEP_ID=MMETSP1474-20131121/46659_1 /ASSEMBLY_ACC=CAM_ASM_001110 /TAXON_ID=97495 /ORGANISM="Imantonia sp., Strain RCC918" /LENGTH=68 /DNA_ID=CAMNT_0053581131 /DNA_START=212 /DNA_END=414 /DNA_ORIENTATION=+